MKLFHSDGTEVGSQDVHVWLKEIIEQNQGEKKIERLKLQPVYDRLVASRTALVQWQEASDLWNDDTTWIGEKTKLLRLTAEWKDGLRMLARHKTSLDEVVEALNLKKQNAKKLWRKDRDKWRTWLTQRKVCEALSKAAGDILKEVAMLAHSVGIQLVYDKLWPVQFPFDKDYFHSPFFIGSSMDLEEELRTPFVQMFESVKQSSESGILGKKSSCLAWMKDNSTNTCCGTILVTPSPVYPQELNLPAAPIACKSIVWCKETFTWDPMCLPYATAPMFLTQYTMHSVIFILAPEVVKANQDLQKFLDDLDAEALIQHKCVYLQPGETVYIPLGWVPVVLTLPCNMDYKAAEVTIPKDPKSGAIQRHHGLYGINLFLSATVMEDSPRLAREVAHDKWVYYKDDWHESMHCEDVRNFYASMRVKRSPATDDPLASTPLA